MEYFDHTTSLPELATAVTAARHRHADLALGNALGSNIFHILLVLGVLVLIAPDSFPKTQNM